MKLEPRKNVFADNIPIWERGQHGGRTRLINKAVMFAITKEFCSVLYSLNIKHCLSHGSALGIYRDGDPITNDDDIDIALFSDDRPKLAAARTKLRELGFFVPDEGDPTKPIDPRNNMPYEDFVAIKNGEKIEGWIFTKIGKYYIYDQHRDGLTIPEEFLDTPLSSIQWRDDKFFIPNNIERFLSIMYGDGTGPMKNGEIPNWRIPQNRKYNNLRINDFEG